MCDQKGFLFEMLLIFRIEFAKRLTQVFKVLRLPGALIFNISKGAGASKIGLIALMI